jgi:hypothetical protein
MSNRKVRMPHRAGYFSVIVRAAASIGVCLASLLLADSAAAADRQSDLQFPADWGAAQRAAARELSQRPYYDQKEHERLFALSARFETSTADGFGQVTPDFDCAGLTMGAQQRIISDESLQGLFQLIEPDRLDALLAEAMPTHGQKFKQLLLTEDVDARLRIVRLWQEPQLKLGECEGARMKRAVRFIADPVELPADDPNSTKPYGAIYDELRALLTTPDMIAAQKQESIGDALCARWIAAVWATRVKWGAAAEPTQAIEAADRAGRGKLSPCDQLPKTLVGLEAPNPRDTAVFYDMRLQPGLVGVMELQAAAMALPRVSPGGDRVEHTFYYATQAQRVDWNVAGSDGRFDPASMRTHAADGRANGRLWQSRYQAKCYDEGQLRLASVVFAKIAGSKSAFLRTVANRKLTVLFGEGCVNGNYMDLRAMYAGAASQPRVVIGCKPPSNTSRCIAN